MRLRIDLPLPPRSHLPNASPGRSRLAQIIAAKETRKYREACAWAAKAELMAQRVAIPPDARPAITSEIRRSRANLDEDGALRYLKHAFDGVADALGIDDRQFRQSIPAQVPGKPYGVTVWIEI